MSSIVWFELPADDTARAQRFYGQLFGWHFERFDGPFEYHMASEAGGAIYPSHGEKGPVVYFGVEDIEREIERVRELGGSAGKKQEIPSVGFFAHCTDTEGNPFSLFEAAAESAR